MFSRHFASPSSMCASASEDHSAASPFRLFMLRSFALSKGSSIIFSISCALFGEKHRGWGVETK